MKHFILLINMIASLFYMSLYAKNTSISDSSKAHSLYNDAKSIYKSDPSKALDLSIASLGISKKTNMTELEILNKTLMGTIYKMTGFTSSAIKQYSEVIDQSENKSYYNHYIGGVNNLSTIYYSSGDYEQALGLLNECLIYAKRHSIDEAELRTVVFNLACIYAEKGDYKKAFKYHNKVQGLSIEEVLRLSKEDKIKSPDLKNAYAYSLAAVGKIYEKKNKLLKSYEYYYEAYKLRKDLELASEIAKSLNDLSRIAYLQEDFIKYKEYAFSSYKISSSKDLLEEKKKSIEHLITYYKQYKIKDSLLKYQQLYIQVIQREDNEKTIRNLSKLMLRKKIHKKELEHKTNIKAIELKKQYISWIAILVIASMTIVVILVIRNSKIKTKINQVISKKNQELDKKNKNILDSINYASRLQKAFMPEITTLKDNFKEIFIFFQPKDIVSGDFYWFSDKYDKKVFVVADCTGHGVPGSMVSMTGNSLLNEIVNERNITSPDMILNELHKGILKTFKKDGGGQVTDGMDITIISIEKKSGKLYFSGSVNPLYVIQKGELKVIKGDVWSIGGGGLFRPGTSLEERLFSLHEIDIEEDMQFYMFTDGYIDQFGGNENKKFNNKRFKKLLLDVSQLKPNEQIKTIKTTIKKWMFTSQKGQIDDMLVVGFRV